MMKNFLFYEEITYLMGALFNDCNDVAFGTGWGREVCRMSGPLGDSLGGVLDGNEVAGNEDCLGDVVRSHSEWVPRNVSMQKCTKHKTCFYSKSNENASKRNPFLNLLWNVRILFPIIFHSFRTDPIQHLPSVLLIITTFLVRQRPRL